MSMAEEDVTVEAMETQAPRARSGWVRKYWKLLRTHKLHWVILTRYKISAMLLTLEVLLLLQFLILSIAGSTKFLIFFLIFTAVFILSFFSLAIRIALYYRQVQRRIDEEMEAEDIDENDVSHTNALNTTESSRAPPMFLNIMDDTPRRRTFSLLRALRRLRRNNVNSETSYPLRVDIRLDAQSEAEAEAILRRYIFRHLRLSLNDRDFTAEDYEMLLRLDEEVANSQCRGMTKGQIEQFPTYLLTQSSSHYGECCPICLEEYAIGDKLMTVGCFHSFHHECGSKWLGISKKCPICMLLADGSQLVIPEEIDPFQSAQDLHSQDNDERIDPV